MTIIDTNTLLFHLDHDSDLGNNLAVRLGCGLGRYELRKFGDGEYKVRALDAVAGKSIYIIHSLSTDTSATVNDKLVILLLFIGALRDSGAVSITLMAPYLCYMRKDSRTRFQDPLSVRYVAQLFEAAGLDHLVAMDVHNVAALENAFRCRVSHISAQALLADYFTPLLQQVDVAVASPDVGGIKRAESFCNLIEARLGKPVFMAYMPKYRDQDQLTSGPITGDVAGKVVLILDDLIASGSTIAHAAEAYCAAGAKSIYVAATHGVFSEGAVSQLASPVITRVVTTNSVFSQFRWVLSRCDTVDVSPLLASFIEHLESNR